MEQFLDSNGCQVRFSNKKNSFAKTANHVLVICRFYNQWLLTKHKNRGLEFPGGKRERGETLEQAAKREVEEETGAIVNSLVFIGEYEVKGTEDSFVKAIYFGEVDTLIEKRNYLETVGPILYSGDLLMERWEEHFSFIMKDKVIELALKILEQKNGKQ
jgi:8-oxo-dGTP diphosphatase